MSNHQLYAQILHLATNFEEHCNLRAKQSNQNKTMNDLVKEVIAQDKQLVWC